MAKQKVTPLMQQYFQIREKYPDTILLFQVGDFYELFFEDAIKVSAYLAIALTKRGKNNGKDIPLCGVPVHALNHYLIKLIKGGFRVAICNQLEKPQPGTVVKRGVRQVFTPGTLTDSVMLDEKSASYIFSFFPNTKNWGLVFAEVLTAQIFATTIPVGAYKALESELSRFFPDEIVLPNLKKISTFNSYFKKLGYVTSFSDFDLLNKNEDDQQNSAHKWLKKQFNQKIVEYVQNQKVIASTINNLYCYLKKNQEQVLDQFKDIKFYKPQDYLILDSATQRNLEIVKNTQDSSRKNTLLSIMDKAKTSMGSRMIKKWLLRPLVNKENILQRLEVVAVLSKKSEILQQLEEFFSQISDLERIIGRVALKRASLQDYLALKDSLKIIPDLKYVITNNFDLYLLNIICQSLVDFSVLIELLDCSLNTDPTKQWIIKSGFDHKLDRLRSLVQNAQQEILKLELKEQNITGINSLKIRYNNISGYYIEVTNPNLKLVPDHYIEQQKLVNRKRFVTQELKDLEREIFKAKTEIDVVEKNVFEDIKNEVQKHLSVLRQLAQALAYLDALYGFSVLAYENDYVAPQFNDNREIIIENGRHPVVEQKLQNNFQPNNTNLTEDQSLWIITGPNMGGKSTYLRQVALCCIMAQCGSFIPAQSASLPILDRIFTRIGSGDNLVEGKSTFLVEMEETATICSMATKNSLVILDEVGRGTSTFDGIALAQSIIEYIFCNVKARCLFATHYHELTSLEKTFNGIKNYFMQSKQVNENLIFLHKIIPGIAQGSFGLQVARLALLPQEIIKRAATILNKMEEEPKTNFKKNSNKNIIQNNLFSNNADNSLSNSKIDDLKKEIVKKDQFIQKFKNSNLEEMSPKQAFDFLWQMHSEL